MAVLDKLQHKWREGSKVTTLAPYIVEVSQLETGQKEFENVTVTHPLAMQ